MDANEILLKDEVFRVMRAAFEVIKELGLAGIPFQQQPRFPVIYKTVPVSEYVPDLIAFGQIIVDAKVIERITDHERGQMLNYLRITGLHVGLLINFKRAKLEWERVILSDHSH